MSKTIHKYKIDGGPVVSEIRFPCLPNTLKLLHVGEQDSYLYIWVELEEDFTVSSTIKRFTIFGTGQTIPSNKYVHVGTVQMRDGFVWHVYEVFA